MITIVGRTPCSADEAVERMRSMVGIDQPYRLGAGDYLPKQMAGGIVDIPWTADGEGVIGSDCWGAAGAWAYKLYRHRPGFNRNRPGFARIAIADRDAPTVVDDINTNSAIEDAEYEQELFTSVPGGVPVLAGDLLCYPTIMLRGEDGDWIRNADGSPKKWIGHVQMVLDPQYAKSGGPYGNAIILQCCGPENRRPAIVMGKATHMDKHDATWPKFEHRTKVIRVRSDIAIVG